MSDNSDDYTDTDSGVSDFPPPQPPGGPNPAQEPEDDFELEPYEVIPPFVVVPPPDVPKPNPPYLEGQLNGFTFRKFPNFMVRKMTPERDCMGVALPPEKLAELKAGVTGDMKKGLEKWERYSDKSTYLWGEGEQITIFRATTDKIKKMFKDPPRKKNKELANNWQKQVDPFQPPPFFWAQCVLYGLPAPASEQEAMKIMKAHVNQTMPPRKDDDSERRDPTEPTKEIEDLMYNLNLDTMWGDWLKVHNGEILKNMEKLTWEKMRKVKKIRERGALGYRAKWEEFLKEADEELGRGWRWEEPEKEQELETKVKVESEVKQEIIDVKKEPEDVKMESVDVKVEPEDVKMEESNDVKIESGVKTEPVEVKTEPGVAGKRPASVEAGSSSKKMKGDELDIDFISVKYRMARLGFFDSEGHRLFTPVPHNSDSEYTKYLLCDLQISATRKQGILAMMEADILAHFQLAHLPKIGERVPVTWRGENNYVPMQHPLAIVGDKEVSQASGYFEWLSPTWLRGEFSIPNFGNARFIAKRQGGKVLNPRMSLVRYWERHWRWCTDIDRHGEKLGQYNSFRFFPDRFGDTTVEVDSVGTSQDEDDGVRFGQIIYNNDGKAHHIFNMWGM
ncbi:hypothetical protein M231_01830 [Tremella mesenterica]|uniref:Uncharacterized protein n=1 Tax=Tremella mesenterica TaxID=5217 RepID=A0A4Q1BSV3_TREME|nr:hypothetical protein M231_01830 [Tremella mesenterica]